MNTDCELLASGSILGAGLAGLFWLFLKERNKREQLEFENDICRQDIKLLKCDYDALREIHDFDDWCIDFLKDTWTDEEKADPEGTMQKLLDEADEFNSSTDQDSEEEL